MFLGQYHTKFFSSGRVILPKKLRQELSGGELIFERKREKRLPRRSRERLILSRGFEKCVWGFSKKVWEKEAKRNLEISATEERARYLRRYLFSGSVEVELDAQGRFVIPSALLSYAKVGKDVVIIGAGDHIEIWNSKFWKKHLRQIEEKYGRIS